MKSGSSSRIRILSVCISIFAVFLIGRLYFVQIVDGSELKSKADHQYVQSTYDYFDRGNIFFKTKDGDLVPAATLKSGYVLTINPTLVLDPNNSLKMLSAIIPIDAGDFLAKAAKINDQYEEVAKRVPLEDADPITALKLPGVSLYKERWRYYPGNSMAAQTIGFLAYDDSNQLAGRYGLERFYENVLHRNNDSVYVNFFAEMFSNIKNSLSSDSSLQGDVVTTIEPSVQSYLEQELVGVMNEWHSDFSGGIIMDPTTGAIYAMASNPTFDINNFQQEKDPSIFSDTLVEHDYEMGSIMKPLTMAAGIDSGAITPTSTYDDTGSLTFNGKTISNYDGRARGVIPMQQVLSQSLNVGAATIEQRTGNATFAKYMLSYGLASTTGIDLPNETYGLNNLKSLYDIDYVTEAYGQGIAVTPIEMIRALSVLANGGVLVTPHIASEIDYTVGGAKVIAPPPGPQVLSKKTTDDVTNMLVTVVDKALLNGTVKMDHYSIAAKTGTAQISKGKGGGYYPDRYLHSFFGYFPAYDPRFIIFLVNYYPKGAKYASETLTPSFIDLAKFLINYYQIPPDR